MARGKGKGRGRFLSRHGRSSGECSTSVESSSRVSQDMQFSVASAVGTSTRRKGKNQTAKQYGSDDFSRDNYCDDRINATADDTAAERPDLEAYCDGSWWDVEILKKSHDKYLVHYLTFSDQENQWVPFAHLRMRSRTSYLSDCCGIDPGIDVCVMTRHPHSDGNLAEWFDAKIIDIERKPHTPKSCKCSFRIALYTIPNILPRDCRLRKLLPVSPNPVVLRKMSIMREARSILFEEIVAASLPDVINSPRIWAKDGVRWFSSLGCSGASWDRSLSFESRVAGGGVGPSLSRGHHEEHTPSLVPELKPFVSFLEEEDIFENPASLSSDESDEDVVIISVVSGSKAQPIDLDMDDVAISEKDDMDDVAISENDGMAYIDYKYLDRYSSDESDERATSPERPEDVLETPNPTTSSECLGNPQEDLDEVVLSDFHPLKPTDRSPLKPISVTSDVSSPLPSVETIPLVSVPVPPVEPATSFENSDVDNFAEYLEQSIAVPEAFPTVESARPSENSDGDGFADYLERNIARNHGAKRSITENHGANHGAKRRRINSQSIGGLNLKSPFLPKLRGKERSRPKSSSRGVQQRSEQVCPKKTVKEQARVYENLETVSVALASSPVKGGNNLDRTEKSGMEDFADQLEGLLETGSPVVADILARLKDSSKTGLPTQGFLSKEKRPKKVGTTVPKNVAKEITYAELFESVEPVQYNIPLEEKGPAEGSSLLPSWNPLMESVGPAPLQEVQDDPFADVWEDMRVAQESGNMGNDEVEKTVEESTKLVGKCEDPDGSERLEHAVTFDQEIGEVCEVCGIVVLEIENMWARDNAKRIATAKEGNNDNDEDNHESDHDGLAFWDSDDDNLKQQHNIEGGSNFELIPDLAKHMQRHQKLGFQFLWRNLAGQDSNGNPCFPPIEPGGCVLSHAPGTGKTFLIISFLQSYMKKYPKCRPVIVAPKIMLQPWEKEFRKWNVDIPVYNFNQACDQGKTIYQKHEEAGDVQLNHARPKKMLPVYREAMLWEWHKTPSVLVISYQMFNLLTLQVPASGDATMLGIKRILLERPNIVILDEGHFARNRLAQVKKQLMAIKTPLRVMLSGTLFQNNFEELYTCLNLVRSGFVKTFAKTAGLKFNMQQETEPQSDVENEQSTTAWKEKAAKAAEAQARKLFIEEIGNKIDKGQLAKSSPESLAQGLEQLRRLTTPFVHHYTGGVLRDLPPLRDFAIVLQPAALQEKLLKKLDERMLEKSMLERECLLSLVCIHPTLLSQHNVGKTLTDLLPPEEMTQAASNQDPAVGVKTRFVINLLKQLRHGQEKMLIFCLNLDPLLLLEEMLKTQFGWVREQEILHIDGKVTADERQSIIERFNDPQGRIRALLLSTKACGEGVTLTGASRVVFMDVLWNPAVIRQAIHRAFRLGQTKVVHVYRLVVTGTFEEAKYRTMVWKDWKSQAIFYASDENHEKVKKSNGEVCGPPQHGFWLMKKQSSKDPVLNELERQDAALDQPAFKHVFRHGGLFDDEYDGDPEGKGADATDWLRGIEGVIPDSYDMEGDIEGGTPDSYDMEGDIEGGTPDSYDTDADDTCSGDGDNDDFEPLEEDVLLAHNLEEKVGRD